jgi:putative DNA primase/helicase
MKSLPSPPVRKAPIGTFWDPEPECFRSQVSLNGGKRYRERLRMPDGSVARTVDDALSAMRLLCARLAKEGRLDRAAPVGQYYLGELGPNVVPIPQSAYADDDVPEIPSALDEAIASWRRVLHITTAENAPDQLKRAALELHRLLLIIKIEAPASHVTSHHAVVDALQELASFHNIDPDDAQMITSTAAKTAAEPPAQATSASTLVTCRASDVEPEKIEWLWPGRIARGKHTAIAGDPGAGKSQLMISIVATVTTGGEFPCSEGRAPIGNVIIMAAEDGVADTVVPRLQAAGANLERVRIITAVRAESTTRTFNLQADLDELSKEIARVGDVALVCIDPVSSYLGKVDSHKNAELRSVLEPLGTMAEQTRAAVLSVTHFSKGGAGASTNSLYRFIGSIAFVAAPRAAFVVMQDPEERERRLFLHSKNNLAKPAQGLAFRLAQCLVGSDKDIVASHVVWDRQPVSVTADEALGAGGGDEPTARDDAADFLRTVLAGGAMPVSDLEQSARAAGHLGPGQPISQSKPFRSARQLLGIKPHQARGVKSGGWFWALPEHQMPSEASDALGKERASDGAEGI